MIDLGRGFLLVFCVLPLAVCLFQDTTSLYVLSLLGFCPRFAFALSLFDADFFFLLYQKILHYLHFIFYHIIIN